MRGRRALPWVALAGVVLIALAVAGAAAVVQNRPRTVGGTSGIFGELEILVPIPQLAEHSDLVVRGVPASHSVQAFRTTYPRPNPELPLRPREADPVYQAIVLVEFRVSEYLKGAGPETLRVSVARPLYNLEELFVLAIEGPELQAKVADALRAGVEYVLFLRVPVDPSRRPEGSVIWSAEQGRFLVRGDVAQRAAGDGLALSLEELRRLVASGSSR